MRAEQERGSSRYNCRGQVRQEDKDLVQYLGRRDSGRCGAVRQQWLQVGTRPVQCNSRRGSRCGWGGRPRPWRGSR